MNKKATAVLMAIIMALAVPYMGGCFGSTGSAESEASVGSDTTADAAETEEPTYEERMDDASEKTDELSNTLDEKYEIAYCYVNEDDGTVYYIAKSGDQGCFYRFIPILSDEEDTNRLMINGTIEYLADDGDTTRLTITSEEGDQVTLEMTEDEEISGLITLVDPDGNSVSMQETQPSWLSEYLGALQKELIQMQQDAEAEQQAEGNSGA